MIHTAKPGPVMFFYSTSVTPQVNPKMESWQLRWRSVPSNFDFLTTGMRNPCLQISKETSKPHKGVPKPHINNNVFPEITMHDNRGWVHDSQQFDELDIFVPLRIQTFWRYKSKPNKTNQTKASSVDFF